MKKRRRLRSAIWVAMFVAASITLLVRSAANAADDPVALKVGILKAAGTLPVLWAAENGIFSKNGISVEVVTLNNGPAITSALMNGVIDVGFAATTAVITAKDSNQTVRLFAPSEIESNDQPSVWIVASEASNIKSMRDLAGKTLAVNAVGGQCEVLMMAHMAAAGMPKGSIKTIILPFPQIFAAVQLKNADAGCVIEPFYSMMTKDSKFAGKPVVTGTFPNLANSARTLFDGYFAREDWLDKNPIAAKKFAATVVEANRKLAEDKTLTASLIQKHLKVSPDIAGTIVPHFQTDTPVISNSEVEPSVDLMRKLGLVKGSFTAADVISSVKQ
jgi:NitT/TauT family transport system substrate-binding protein